jgi:branched-subunit amino acid transport protein AzlD
VILSTWESISIIAVVAVCTFATRAIPFALFAGSEQVPKNIQYLGKVLPTAVIATLIVYCLKGVNFTQYPSGIAELIAIAVVASLHLWRRSFLLSIGVGTVCYMVLVQFVFAQV